jgi:hypothetical protein
MRIRIRATGRNQSCSTFARALVCLHCPVSGKPAASASAADRKAAAAVGVWFEPPLSTGAVPSFHPSFSPFPLRVLSKVGHRGQSWGNGVKRCGHRAHNGQNRGQTCFIGLWSMLNHGMRLKLLVILSDQMWINYIKKEVMGWGQL